MGNGQLAGIDADQYSQGGETPLVRADRPAEETGASLILAHGAGAPMDSPFMAEITEKLVARGIAVYRFEFAYMAARRVTGRRRPPDPQARLLEQWRAVYRSVRQQTAGLLAIGGKSMGGRMASLLSDEIQVDALVCLGYPFYAVGKPDKPRVAHLAELRTPSLIVQGERDALGDREAVAAFALSPTIHLEWLEAADHDLKPLKRSGFTHSQHLEAAADLVAAFLLDRLQRKP